MYELRDRILKNIFKHIPLQAKLKRKSKVGNIIAAAPELKESKYDISKYLKFDKYNEIIADFYSTLTENFSRCDLSAFYHNTKILKINDNRDKVYLSTFLEKLLKINILSEAEYDTKTNTISLFIEDLIGCTGFHELLHMATTRKTKNMVFCGFSQHSTNIFSNYSIGNSLNEGYTEYLVEKYFYKDKKYVSYPEEQNVATMIEKIVGSKKMEELYFASDLRGLVEEMSQYTSPENAIRIINKMDKILKGEADMNYILRLRSNKDYKELRRDIADIYLEKQRQLLARGEITEEQFLERELIHVDLYVEENIVFTENAKISRIGDNTFTILDNNKEITVPYSESSTISTRDKKHTL